MARTHANIINDIESKVQDGSNAQFTAAELLIILKTTLKQVAQIVPHALKITYKIESRTGATSSTLANNLVDATKSQFLSTDVDKVVYNSTDKTWAIITTYTSATTVVLSKDIMAAGENYEIYNKGCISNKQINVGDVKNALWIKKLEYPVGTRRKFTRNGDIVTIGIDFDPDDSNPTKTGFDVDVDVYFDVEHFLSQLTDFAGAVDNGPGYAVGSVSMLLKNLQTTGTILEGQEFTIAGVRGTYIVIAEAAVATSAGTIKFFPGLVDAVADDDVVTFKASTLDATLEGIAVDYSVGNAKISKSNKGFTSLTTGEARINVANKGGPGVAENYSAYARAWSALGKEGYNDVAGAIDRLERIAIANSEAIEDYPESDIR